MRARRAGRRRPEQGDSTAISAPATRPGLGRCRWPTTWACACATWTPPRPAAPPTSSTSPTRPQAIAAGKCNVALITLAGRPRSEGQSGTAPRAARPDAPDAHLGSAVRPDDGQRLRHVRHAPHARVRHHLRAARLDQGRRLPPRPAQPARHAARRGHGRGCGGTRRWSPTRCTGWIAASSPTAAAR